MEALAGKRVRVRRADPIFEVVLRAERAGIPLAIETIDPCPMSCVEGPDGRSHIQDDTIEIVVPGSAAIAPSALLAAVPERSPWRFRVETLDGRDTVALVPTHVRTESGWREVTAVLDTVVDFDRSDGPDFQLMTRHGARPDGVVDARRWAVQLLRDKEVPVEPGPNDALGTRLSDLEGLPAHPTAREFLIAATAAADARWLLVWSNDHYILELVARDRRGPVSASEMLEIDPVVLD
ncbi:MAG: hypothetical protein H6737_22590 [Alphaproteobacteria bacterium]|nr:hypothetical protein [Alphaproteobacteria bacterium]